MGMRVLDEGQWSPCPTDKPGETKCGSNGGGDCLVFEVADAGRGDLIISDTDRTFRGKIQGHEVEQFVRAYVAGQLPADIMAVIAADCARYEAEMAGYPPLPEVMPARA